MHAKKIMFSTRPGVISQFIRSKVLFLGLSLLTFLVGFSSFLVEASSLMNRRCRLLRCVEFTTNRRRMALCIRRDKGRSSRSDQACRHGCGRACKKLKYAFARYLSWLMLIGWGSHCCCILDTGAISAQNFFTVSRNFSSKKKVVYVSRLHGQVSFLQAHVFL